MKYIPFQVSLFGILLVILNSSCQQNNGKQINMLKKMKFIDAYIVDTAKCELTVAGTDSYSEVIFLTDSDFVYYQHSCCGFGMDHPSVEMKKGKYIIQDNIAELSFNEKIINQFSLSQPDSVVYKTEYKKNKKLRFKIYNCNKAIFLKDVDENIANYDIPPDPSGEQRNTMNCWGGTTLSKEDEKRFLEDENIK